MIYKKIGKCIRHEDKFGSSMGGYGSGLQNGRSQVIFFMTLTLASISSMGIYAQDLLQSSGHLQRGLYQQVQHLLYYQFLGLGTVSRGAIEHHFR
jgi:hypothetical protein